MARSEPPRDQAPRHQLRDGVLLVLLGLAVGAWQLRTDTLAASSLGFVIAGWGLLLVATAVWPRWRRRT